MKKMNKKGFTLIELLAVIIILGVLMIIAIPSVTTYIQNSRKSAWVDTGVAYIKSTVNKVNEGGKLQFFKKGVLYLVPAGHDDEHSCVPVESGGQSPFSSTWNYAYVGVIYNGDGYDYYYIAEDGAGQGVPFLTQKVLGDEGTEKMYAGTEIGSGTTDPEKMLSDAYNEEANAQNPVARTINKPQTVSDGSLWANMEAAFETRESFNKVVIVNAKVLMLVHIQQEHHKI